MCEPTMLAAVQSFQLIFGVPLSGKKALLKQHSVYAHKLIK